MTPAVEFEVVYSGALERESAIAQQIHPHRQPSRPRQTQKTRRAATEVVSRAMRRRRGYPWTVHEVVAATGLTTQQATGAIATLLRHGEIVRAEHLVHRLPGRYRWLGLTVIG